MEQDVTIWERESQRLITAVFNDEVGATDLAKAESQWKPVRDAAVDRLKANGKSEREIGMMLQHAHWDWLQKAPYAGLLAMPCLGIRVKEEWQGLAMIELGVKRAELQPDQGKEIVCIEFLEVAPWNLKSMVDKPKYKLVGSRLVEAAVQISISESWHGRVGLFALPQAEQFYQGCGMVKVEGAGRKGMQWYEMSRGAAQAFISGGA